MAPPSSPTPNRSPGGTAPPDRVISPTPVPTGPLRARRFGVDTHHHPVVFLRSDSPVCRSEGFEALARVLVHTVQADLTCDLLVVTSDLLASDEVGLSDAAWSALGLSAGDPISLGHAPDLDSFSRVRAKVHGARLGDEDFAAIIGDIAAARYGDVQLASFVTACAGDRLDITEMIALTRAMLAVGDRLDWGRKRVVDKHCVGGLPGNRTTPIVVAIAAEAGLTIPKTSSRAITSPAGTADVMETLTRVDLDLDELRSVVEEQGGCLAWGGSVALSPTDDMLIRVERALDIDGQGQLVASILSKKAAAGATHVVIDIPWGPTAKVRSLEAASRLRRDLQEVGEAIGLDVAVVLTDGTVPVGRGVGPALEATDVLAVLRCDPDAPADLRKRAVILAGTVLEHGGASPRGEGRRRAQEILDSGGALRRFEAICQAQGGLFTPPVASWTHPVTADRDGVVRSFDNRGLARVAKLAGAPADPAAGLLLHVRRGDRVRQGQPLFTLHAESEGELAYALAWLDDHPNPVQLGAAP